MRGCGTRSPGGIYFDIPLEDPDSGYPSKPIEHFIVDPPDVIDIEAWGIKPRGVSLIQRGDTNIHDIYDWVGEKYYPFPADFIEEARVQGVSRRARANLDFSKITEASRLVVIHKKAHIVDAFQYYDHWVKPVPSIYKTYDRCPAVHCNCADWERETYALHNDKGYAGMCAGTWWQDLPVSGLTEYDEETGIGVRRQPGCVYKAAARHESIKPEYRPAVFAIFPIPRLAVIIDNLNQLHEEAAEKAKASSIKVKLMEE